MCEAFYAINSFAWNVHGTDDEVEAGLGRLKEITHEITALDGDRPPMMRMLAPVVAMFVGDHDNLPELTERAVNDEDPWVAAAIRTFRASMAENDGDPVAMRKDAEEAVVVFRELGERWGIANSLQVLGQLELMEGNLEAAAAAYREGIDMATEVGSREDVAMMRLRLSDILTRNGDREAAEEQAELARQAARGAGSPYEVLFTHVVQVEIYRGRGELDRAREFYEAAIERLEGLPSVHPIRGHGLAMLQCSAAKIDLDDGNLDRAADHLRMSWSLAIDTKDMPIVANVAVAVAMLAERTARPELAAEMLGAAAQLRGADDATATDVATLAAALGGLSDGPYAEAYARGRGLSREQALARVDPATLT
jgi:ATP/maltotriose-dependent transcriptional regulator MalT